MSLLWILIDVALLTVVSIAMMVLTGILARRLFDMRIGTVRIILAGLLGLGAGLGFESRFVWGEAEYSLALLPVLIGVIMLVTIAFLVLFELVAPQGSIPRVDQWGPGLRRALSRNRRYAELVRIAGRHGLIPFTLSTATDSAAVAERRRQGLALRDALQEAGGAFVKLGQLLSTRPDVLPVEITDALASLQQRVEPAPYAQIRPVLERALGAPIESVFSHLSTDPLAAASIGQVYRGTLLSGEEVAVKVRRPGVVPLVERDLSIARRLADRFHDTSAWARRMGVKGLVDNLGASLEEELDYTLEASNITGMEQAQSALRPEARVRVLRCHTALSTEEVLVMEFVRGDVLSDARALASRSPEERRALAARLFAAMLSQIAEAGIFHADPHPGNIVVTEAGELELLDLGSVGTLDSLSRGRLVDLLMAVARGDTQQFADGLIAFVELPDEIDEIALRRDIGSFMASRMGGGRALDAAALAETLTVLSRHGLAIPSELTLPFRALGTVEGSLRALDPDFDLVAAATAYSDARRASFREPSTLREALEAETATLLPMLQRLPRRVDRLGDDLARGRLSVNVRVLADRRDRWFLRSIVDLAALAFLAGVFGIMAALLLTSDVGPQVTDTLSLFQLFGYLCLVVTGILTFRVLFDTMRRRSAP